VLTQADMEKAERKHKFEPACDIRNEVRNILKQLKWIYISSFRNRFD